MDLGDQQQTMDLKIFDPLDMNSKDFNLDIYMTKVWLDLQVFIKM